MASQDVNLPLKENVNVQVCKEENKVREHGSAKPENDQQQSAMNCEDWQLNTTLSSSLLHLYEHKLWTDVSFKCRNHAEDNTDDRIKVHKIILAARSPVFKAMFFGPCANGKEEQELLTVEAEIFELAVRYIYSEQTNLTESNVSKVMELAHMYQISGLVMYCSKFMISILKPANACEILELALFYDLKELNNSACQVIDDNARQIIQLDTFMNTSETCLTYILKGDTFFEKESTIVKAAERWAEHNLTRQSININGQEIRNILGKGFYYLRVPMLSIAEFSEFSKGKSFYTIDEMDEIIEHISKHQKAESVTCHSALKRRPRQQNVKIPSAVERYRCHSDIDDVQSTLLLRVMKTCKLKGVHVKKFTGLMNGVLDIENTFKMKFTVLPLLDENVTLTKPLLLTARETPYTLKLELKHVLNEKMARRFEFEYSELLPTELVVSPTQETDTDLISFAYSEETKERNIITSIDVCNLSFRNRET